MGWSDRLFGRRAPRTVTLNGRPLEIETEDGQRPTGAEIRRVAALDDSRLLIDGETRQIVGPAERPLGDDLYDAPRFSKGHARA